jgi:hypothetical protein
MNDSNQPDFEIVGHQNNDCGRTCNMHTHCGMHVEVNVSVREDNEPEEAITMVKVVDGTDTCTVGFVL